MFKSSLELQILEHYLQQTQMGVYDKNSELTCQVMLQLKKDQEVMEITVA